MKTVSNQEIFGLDNIEAFVESCKDSLSGPKMAVLTILSDAQVLMEMGNTEMARKYINRAKVVAVKCLEAKE